MPWNFDNSIPIYVQLVESLKLLIISGKIQPGDKLNSVRDLAQEAGVNPNTMQRALAELERENLIYSLRTSGRFVTDDEELISLMRTQIASEKIDGLFQSLYKLGFSKDEVGNVISQKINNFGKGDLNGGIN